MNWYQLSMHRHEGCVRWCLTLRGDGRSYIRHRKWSLWHLSGKTAIPDGSDTYETLRLTLVDLETVLGERHRADD